MEERLENEKISNSKLKIDSKIEHSSEINDRELPMNYNGMEKGVKRMRNLNEEMDNSNKKKNIGDSDNGEGLEINGNKIINLMESKDMRVCKIEYENKQDMKNETGEIFNYKECKIEYGNKQDMKNEIKKEKLQFIKKEMKDTSDLNALKNVIISGKTRSNAVTDSEIIESKNYTLKNDRIEIPVNRTQKFKGNVTDTSRNIINKEINSSINNLISKNNINDKSALIKCTTKNEKISASKDVKNEYFSTSPRYHNKQKNDTFLDNTIRNDLELDNRYQTLYLEPKNYGMYNESKSYNNNDMMNRRDFNNNPNNDRRLENNGRNADYRRDYEDRYYSMNRPIRRRENYNQHYREDNRDTRFNYYPEQSRYQYNPYMRNESNYRRNINDLRLRQSYEYVESRNHQGSFNRNSACDRIASNRREYRIDYERLKKSDDNQNRSYEHTKYRNIVIHSSTEKLENRPIERNTLHTVRTATENTISQSRNHYDSENDKISTKEGNVMRDKELFIEKRGINTERAIKRNIVSSVPENTVSQPKKYSYLANDNLSVKEGNVLRDKEVFEEQRRINTERAIKKLLEFKKKEEEEKKRIEDSQKSANLNFEIQNCIIKKETINFGHNSSVQNQNSTNASFLKGVNDYNRNTLKKIRNPILNDQFKSNLEVFITDEHRYLAPESFQISSKIIYQIKDVIAPSTIYDKPKIKIKPSIIHGNGVFASEEIQKDQIIGEYIGQIISKSHSDVRESNYKRQGTKSIYMFAVSNNQVIDATMYGSKLRFVNHSCEPNCYAEIKIFHGNVRRVYFAAERNIQKGEELTIDYQFQHVEDEERVVCHCKTPRCRSYIDK